MTWLVFLLGTAAAAAIAVGFYLLGLRSRQIDAGSYWQGFADGELHQRLNDRTPSHN